MHAKWLNKESSKRRTLPVVIFIAVGGLLLTFITAYLVHDTERQLLQSRFHQDVLARSSGLIKELELNLESLHALDVLFGNTQNVPPSSHINLFQQKAQAIITRRPAIISLKWVPLVMDTQRVDLEQNHQRYYQGFEITEISNEYQLVTAAQRKQYLPVYYSEPATPVESMLGVDLLDIAELRNPLLQAIDTGTPFSDNVVHRGEEDVGHIGVFLPIYMGIPASVERRQQNFIGFILGEMSIDSLLRQSDLYEHNESYGIRILNLDDDGKEYVLHEQAFADVALPGIKDVTIEIANGWGIRFQLQARASAAYMHINSSSAPFMVFITGTLLTFIVATYVNMVFRRNAYVRTVVKTRTYELAEANRKLSMLNHTDGLTGVANRRAFDEALEKVWQRARRNRTYVSLLFIDIDNFKEYNDAYGHLAGDECLKKVATALSTLVNRTDDMIARYGGEEFVILLPDSETAAFIAEKCVKTIRQLIISHDESQAAKMVTISVGCATAQVSMELESRSLVAASDMALYKAKEKGKNCYVDASKVTSINVNTVGELKDTEQT